MSAEITREEAIFSEALELSGQEERQAYLREACAADDEMYQRLEALIRSHETERFLEDPAILELDVPSLLPASDADGTRLINPVTAVPGDSIGRYKLLEQIGEGGFGVVFMAEQEKPVHRKVALKIIKAGMDTKQVIARFEAERQALAMMDHPNIAKVHDAGATENGRPYFVMELVRGLPITKFCEENQLTVKERIELFIPVCQAIQHAHQNGIIHRDIKPSNVLVTRNEGVPHAMVIDFGVAKAIDHRLTEKTLFTNLAQMIGTPSYMSPEQAEMSQQAVDTRTDVYSLGILLYELLIGTTPFPEERLKEVGYAEIQRIISQEEPVRPSTVLSRLNGRSKTVAANRRCEPAALKRLIKGDLDWIVLRAIDKDRNRRYATPLELAADLQRYMADEPVTAVAPSTLYTCRKFARRNRAAVAIGLAVLFGVFFSTWQAVRATRAQAAAERQAQTAEAALRFVQEDLFRRARYQPDVKLVDAMQSAVIQMADRYHNQPLVEAAILLTMGKGYRRLGQYLKAQEYLARSIDLHSELLGLQHEKTLEGKVELAWVLSVESKFEEAMALIEEVVAVCQARLGPSHEQTLKAMVCAGHLYDYSAQHEKAEQTLKRALDLALQTPEPNFEIVHDAFQGLAWVASSRGDREKVLKLRHEAFKIASEHFGPDDPQTLHDACFRVQHLGLRLKRYEEASLLANDTYQRLMRVLGPDHVKTRWILNAMAFLDQAKGFHIIPDLRQLLKKTQQEIQDDQWDLLWPQFSLGTALVNNRNFEEGATLLADVRERNTRLEGIGTWLSRRSAGELARCYTLQGQFTQAQNLHLELLAVGHEVLGADAPWVREQSRLLATLLARQGKWAEATQAFKTCVEGSAPNRSALVPALLVGWLANDRQSLSHLGNQVFLSLSTNRNPSERFQLAQGLLLTLDRIPNLNVTQAIQASEQAIGLQVHPVKKARLTALAAWRNQDWNRARKQARYLMAEDDGNTASLGGFVQAIAAHFQSDAPPALQSLASARERLESVLSSGDLGPAWMQPAMSLIAGEVAASILQDQGMASKINPTWLAQARADWQPVHQLLDAGDWAARRGDSNVALKEFHKAMAHPRFSWDAAMLRDTKLGSKLSALLSLTGQSNQYPTLWREKIQSSDALLVHPDILDAQLLESALNRAQGTLAEMPDTQKSAEARHELELTIGMAEYRRENFTEARHALEKAQGAFNLNCSGTAAAFAALASWKQGLTEESRSLLGKAERTYRDLMKRNEEDLGPHWYRTAVLEIALREAQQILNEDIEQQGP